MEIIDVRKPEAAPVGGWLQRPVLDTRNLEEKVAAILAEVRRDGDAAVRKFSLAFDKSAPEVLELTAAEIASGAEELDESLKTAIRRAAENITTFHQLQLRQEASVETMPGVRCWRKSIGIEKVGLYIPGGTAPLFSTLLMLAIPAKL